MFRKTYTVKGDDVNDFMVMENFAYLSYTVRILQNFLFEKGYSRRKLNDLNLGLQEFNHELIYHKRLMFNEVFFIEMEFNNDNPKINIKNRFFNLNNELCVEVSKELNWYDYNRGEIAIPPKQMIQHFSNFQSTI
jgi:acyl-CoA thioesterase FadM